MALTESLQLANAGQNESKDVVRKLVSFIETVQTVAVKCSITMDNGE